MDAAMARIIDHTLLKPDASYDQIEQLSREAIECQFASVCVHPAMVQTAYDIVKGTNVKVCSVIGFPLGATLPEVKAFETKNVIANGATEVDMVINIGALKSREYETVKADIDAVVEAAKNKALVKVIVETALLNREELVKACEIAKEADAHFVKTSTGFAGAGAQTEDISIMKKVVGDKLKVKASGGIRDYDTAKAMVEAGADRIGTSSGTVICGAKLD